MSTIDPNSFCSGRQSCAMSTPRMGMNGSQGAPTSQESLMPLIFGIPSNGMQSIVQSHFRNILQDGPVTSDSMSRHSENMLDDLQKHIDNDPGFSTGFNLKDLLQDLESLQKLLQLSSSIDLGGGGNSMSQSPMGGFSPSAPINSSFSSAGVPGLDNIPGEQQNLERPTAENTDGRPADDTRTAEEIIDDNPVLKNLGDQKDIKRDLLKEQCGDWTSDNTDPESRADAAYNMAKVLNWIDGSNDSDGNSRGLADGDIQGITSSGDARHGTEAGKLKDFAEQGFGVFSDDQRLDKSNDKQVRKDGSNKDNFEHFVDQVGEVFSPVLQAFSFIPGLDMVGGMAGQGLNMLGSDGMFSTSTRAGEVSDPDQLRVALNGLQAQHVNNIGNQVSQQPAPFNTMSQNNSYFSQNNSPIMNF